MLVNDSQMRRRFALVGLGSVALTIAISLALAVVFTRVADIANEVTVGQGINTVSTTFMWTTTGILTEGLQIIAVVAGILSLATSRTYLGAGVTRHAILAHHAKIGAVVVVTLIAVIAGFWGLSFIGDGPVLEGVSATTIILTGLAVISMYVWGSMLAALFLRFRAVPVGIGLFLALVVIVALMVIIALNSPGSGLVEGTHVSFGPRGATLFPFLGEVTGAFATAAVLILGGGAITHAAMLTLPMRRS